MLPTDALKSILDRQDRECEQPFDLDLHHYLTQLSITNFNNWFTCNQKMLRWNI